VADTQLQSRCVLAGRQCCLPHPAVVRAGEIRDCTHEDCLTPHNRVDASGEPTWVAISSPPRPIPPPRPDKPAATPTRLTQARCSCPARAVLTALSRAAGLRDADPVNIGDYTTRLLNALRQPTDNDTYPRRGW
jgi:hypothetical protein